MKFSGKLTWYFTGVYIIKQNSTWGHTGQLYPGRDTFEFDQGHVTKNHPSHSVHFAGWKSSYVTTKFWWTVIISACWKKTRTSQPSLNSRIHWTSSHLASAKIHPSQSHEAESKSENTLKSCSTFKGISFSVVNLTEIHKRKLSWLYEKLRTHS